MNDVLPKPFTKEGLLNMLEKHLGHLKQSADGMEPIAQHGGSVITQTSAGQSLKDESSPAPSPSTISNWQSPGQFTGMSPTNAAPNHFMQPMHQGYGHEHSQVQYQSTHTPITPMGGPRKMQHRRQISELGADDIPDDSKRQRMYEQTHPIGMTPMQQGRPLQ